MTSPADWMPSLFSGSAIPAEHHPSAFVPYHIRPDDDHNEESEEEEENNAAVDVFSAF